MKRSQQQSFIGVRGTKQLKGLGVHRIELSWGRRGFAGFSLERPLAQAKKMTGAGPPFRSCESHKVQNTAQVRDAFDRLYRKERPGQDGCQARARKCCLPRLCRGHGAGSTHAAGADPRRGDGAAGTAGSAAPRARGPGEPDGCGQSPSAFLGARQ